MSYDYVILLKVVPCPFPPVSKPHSLSQDLMKLRFFVPWHRRNQARDKVIGKK